LLEVTIAALFSITAVNISSTRYCSQAPLDTSPQCVLVSHITAMCAVCCYAGLQDVADSLQQHAADVAELQQDFQPHQLLPTASSLLRVLKVSTHWAGSLL
jgi:hypothetical protein